MSLLLLSSVKHEINLILSCSHVSCFPLVQNAITAPVNAISAAHLAVVLHVIAAYQVGLYTSEPAFSTVSKKAQGRWPGLIGCGARHVVCSWGRVLQSRACGPSWLRLSHQPAHDSDQRPAGVQWQSPSGYLAVLCTLHLSLLRVQPSSPVTWLSSIFSKGRFISRDGQRM